MASTSIKNQNTLFRFVSLRSPQLTKDKGKEIRFVFAPDKTSPFYTAVINRPSTVTRWRALTGAATSFSAFASTSQIIGLTGAGFYETATWLSINKSNFADADLLGKITGLTQLSITALRSLWDNLYYQVVTQKDFYVKEALIEVLVLNNLIKYWVAETEGITLSALANARVVLPFDLFEPEAATATTPSTPPASGPTTEEKANNIVDAKKNISDMEMTKAEIEELEKSHQYEMLKGYKAAYKIYQDSNQESIDQYTRDWHAAKRAMCDAIPPGGFGPTGYCAEPDMQFPKLPAFEYETTDPVSSEQLRGALSSDSFEKIDAINPWGKISNFTDIKRLIDIEVNKQNQVIVDNTDFSSQVFVAGGVTIELQKEHAPITIPSGDEELGAAFIPKKFGVRQIGIADYKKVVSHVCCYDAGEVSHIENIMAKEVRSKTTTRERIEENTETTERQEESEHLTDNSTSQRFEMQKEVAKVLQEQTQFSANASFSASWGAGASYTLGLGANYSNNTSSEESNRQAVTQAKEITQRAMERVVTKIRTELVQKTTESYKEENLHAYDNRTGNEHVSGVYRYINAIYQNQIYNYGKRMMYEFMIPQPSKLHRLGMLNNQSNSITTVVLQKPNDPRLTGLGDASYINEVNAKVWASKLGAEVKPCPTREIYSGKSFSFNNDTQPTTYSEAGTIEIPENYLAQSARVDIAGILSWHGWPMNIMAVVGTWCVVEFPNHTYNLGPFYIPPYKNTFPVSVGASSFQNGNIVISVNCRLTDEAYQRWQQESFNAIIKAYEDKLAAYYASLEQNRADSTFGTNPGFYRQIEQMVLRKNCISYLMDEANMGLPFYSGDSLMNFKITQTEDMDNYASMVKFMEQAFEWELLSYNYYPFYWGNRKEWQDLYQYDCNDPLFRSFMQAGMARVIVTVRPGFESAVMHYMATGQLWNGGQVPVLGDPLFLSIVDELSEQEYVVEETWETVVPTSLIGLQKSGVSVDAEGLPCGDGCEDHAGSGLVRNPSTLTMPGS